MNYTFEDVEAIRREAQQELQNELERWGFNQEVTPVQRYHVMAVLRVRERIIRSQQADADELPLGVSSLGELLIPAPEPLRPALLGPEPEEPGPPAPPAEPEPPPLKLMAGKTSDGARAGKPRGKVKRKGRSEPPRLRAEVEQRWAERAEVARKILLERHPMPVPLHALATEVMGRIPAGKEVERLLGALRQLLGEQLILSGRGTRKGPITILLCADEPPAGRQENLNPKLPSSAPGPAPEGKPARLAPKPAASPVERLPEGGFIRPVEPSPQIKAMLERMAAGRASAVERAKMLICSEFRPEYKRSVPRTPSRLTELARRLFRDRGYDHPAESYPEDSTPHKDWLECLERARRVMQSENEVMP